MVDWTKAVNKVALILKDDKNAKPAPENVGATRSALFMPTRVRVTVTVVSPGSTYVPPGPPPGDAGVDAAKETSVDAPAEAAMDAVVEDTAVDDTAIASDTGTATTSDAVVSDTDTVVSDAGTDDGGGCSTSRSTQTSGAGLLALAVLALRRRR